MGAKRPESLVVHTPISYFCVRTLLSLMGLLYITTLLQEEKQIKNIGKGKLKNIYIFASYIHERFLGLKRRCSKSR